MTEELFREMAQTIIDGDPEAAEALAKRVLAEGIDR
jgi:methanogenic corrinoid protein MtbC1